MHADHYYSVGDGRSWKNTDFGKDCGRPTFRPWNFRFMPEKKGRHAVMAKAADRSGNTRTFELIRNPAGHHHNVCRKSTPWSPDSRGNQIHAQLDARVAAPLGAVSADESQIRLKNDAGRDSAQTKCSINHSLDEIRINPSFLGQVAALQAVDAPPLRAG
jgi:hypothetical protein